MSAVNFESLDWQADALCAKSPPGVTWFPEGLPGGGVTSDTVKQIARAKAICAVCPAKEPCLEYALALRLQDGIWGGETTKSRRSINSQRRKAARR